MTLLLISFLAGVLTVLAPCVLPLLPVVIGGSAADHTDKWKPYIITGSLALSVIVFTLLLKVSTLLIDIPPDFWKWFSGGVLILLSITLLFPSLWERLPINALINRKSQTLLATGSKKKNIWGDVLMGMALGPVFSTCSPTYFVILATVLPSSFVLGMTYLLAYTLGLALMLILIAVLGQRLVGKLGGAADSRGWVKRGMGLLILLVGIAVISGYDKKLETALLDAGIFDVTQIEQRLLEETPMPTEELPQSDDTGPDTNSSATPDTLPDKVPRTEEQATRENRDSASETAEKVQAVSYPSGPKAPEITRPDGFLNTNGQPITIGEFRNNKVVLVDFWTYSCINCQRTIPYLNTWYERYKDKGLVILGIHTPEFAFEKKMDNVAKAVAGFGIQYPIVLDNGYHTWTAFANRFWPRKYLIDERGTIIYDHIGEGGYEETERQIQEALARLDASINLDSTGGITAVDVDFDRVESPETYFGASRNKTLGNGKAGVVGVQSFEVPDSVLPNILYLGGDWRIEKESAQTESTARVLYTFTAKNVYMVAASTKGQVVDIFLDGVRVDSDAGTDVQDGAVSVQDERLYHLVELDSYGTHTLELRIPGPGVSAYTFTFG